MQRLQNSFTGGEVTPKIYARADLGQFNNSLSVCENFIIWAYGGLQRRPGTRYTVEVKDSSKKVRLIPFVFKTEQAYMLEFGHNYMRIVMNYGQVQSSGTPYEIATPYIESDLPNLKFIQSKDVMWIVDGRNPVKKLSRTGHTAWTLTDATFLYGPFNSENLVDTQKLAPSATTGTGITITATGCTPFTASDVGRLLAIKNGTTAKWGYATITGFTSSSVVTVTVTTDFQTTTADYHWKLGSFYGSNQPKAIGIFSERLWFAGTPTHPETMWSSKTNNWDDFSTTAPVEDTDAITFTIADGKVNAIRWMEQMSDAVVIGTSDGIFRMYPSDASKVFSATTLKIQRMQTFGSKNIQGKQIGTTVHMVQSGGRILNEIAYVFSDDSYQAPQMTLLSEHLTHEGITDFVYQSRPDQIVWAVRADGVLLGFTYMRDQKVTGWHRHTLSGEVEALGVIPSPDETHDDVYMVVKRTINGQTKRYIEYIEHYDFDTNADWFFVDCGLTYSGSPVTTITGLDHLEGKELAVLADGARHAKCTVTGGHITLLKPASKVQVGLPLTATVKTLPVEINPQIMAQTKRKSIYAVMVDFFESCGGKVGPALDKLNQVFMIPREAGPEPETGYKEIKYPGGWELNGQVYVVQDEPLPMNILSIGTLFNLGDK